MEWIVLSLFSAFFLGLYDLSQKHALRENAVLPVIFLSTVTGGSIWGLLLAFQAISPASMPAALHVAPISLHDHLLLFLKSAIVGSSWIFTYFGMKHLPVSLAAPIRATSPLWTLTGALFLLGERPNVMESIGIATTLISFVGLSVAGSKEGIHFHRNKWVWYILFGTLLGAISSLYDRYLLGTLHFPVSTVQAWFSIYTAVVFLPFVIGWKLRLWPRNNFTWRWTIPMIAIALLVADFAYFSALRHPDAMVSVVTSLRRASTLVAFAGGLLLYKEVNGRQKLPAVLGVLLGITFTILGRR